MGFATRGLVGFAGGVALSTLLHGCYTEGRAHRYDGTDGERERFATIAECAKYAEKWGRYECRRYALGYFREAREYVDGKLEGDGP